MTEKRDVCGEGTEYDVWEEKDNTRLSEEFKTTTKKIITIKTSRGDITHPGFSLRPARV